MTTEQRTAFESDLRTFLGSQLEGRLEDRKFGDDESLFLSGKLDSLAAIQLIVFLEKESGPRLDSTSLTLAKIDTFRNIVDLICET